MSWTSIISASGTGWTDEAKPTALSSILTITATGGEPIGLLISITATSVTGTTFAATQKWTSIASHTTP